MSLSLHDFVDQWASNTILLPANDYDTPSQQPYRLRPSRLGRPAYVTALEHLVHLHGNNHQAVDNTEYYGRNSDIFRTGHDVEARIVEVMRSANVETFDYQVPTSFELHGYTIEGTADIVLGDTVIDVKTASASNFKRLLSGYNDLTYRTQLALYAHGLNLPRAALLLYNKDNSELQLKYITLTDEVARVTNILGELKLLEEMTLENAYEYIQETFIITEPPSQMRAKVPTGKYLVPSELWYSPVVCNILWSTEYGSDGVRYVTSSNPDPVTTIRDSFM
jgi:hypothetical protein